MAKRKNTENPSTKEAAQQPDAESVEVVASASAGADAERDIVADAVDAVEVYAPSEKPTEGHAAEQETGSVDDEAETPHHDTDEIAAADADPKDPDKAPTDQGAAASEPQATPDPQGAQGSGGIAMFLGGVAAAVLGYGVAGYSSQAVWPFSTGDQAAFEAETQTVLTAQADQISGVEARLATLENREPPAPDLSGIQQQLNVVKAANDAVAVRLDDFAARIEQLERQPLESTASQEAIAAYDRALADLRAEIETQRAEVAQMAAEAVAAEENAEDQAQLAASRAALAEVVAALDAGGAYTAPLTLLVANGVDVPVALRDPSERGVPTLAELREAFPDAARDALRVARNADTDGAEGLGRVSTFFANQLGARSVVAKEGEDADAVLSRAEAALRAGDLGAAMSELSVLPDIAQEPLAQWRAQAEIRRAAQTAADALVQNLLKE